MEHHRRIQDEDCRAISASAGCIEEAEKEIFIHVHQGRDYEATSPTRTGHLGKPGKSRCASKFFYSSTAFAVGVFHKQDQWLMFMANRAAIVRAATGRPPNKSRNLCFWSRWTFSNDSQGLNLSRHFVSATCSKSVTHNLAMLIVYNEAQSKKEES
jgi:hypothetical protein